MSLNVKKILNGEIVEKYNDRIFWYASKVILEDNQVSIYVDNENLVTFDDINLNIKKISEFKNIKQKNNFILKNVLISSGSFLFINNKLVVTQRDSFTKYDPNHWTTPAGRCDRTIFETAIKETIEEIEIKKNYKKLFPTISAPFVSEESNIEFYKTSFRNIKLPLKTYKVKLYLDDKLVEECLSWMYYVKDVNTIEFRIPLFTEMDECHLKLSNPEFNTETELKTINELKKLQTVPALTQLIRELENVNI